ncbi:hypothetical protein MTO96_003306 [Rhipicephalus appendiculatus]
MFILRTSLLLIFYKSGSSMASSILDLAKEVEIYVRTCKPDGLNSLNITGGERRNNLSSVTAHVSQIEYHSGCSKKLGEKRNDPGCKNAHIWLISCGIAAPLNLFANFTVPNKQPVEGAFLFDINNATQANWNPDNVTAAEKDHAISSIQACTFNIPIIFSGYFTYDAARPIGDNPLKDPVGIGNAATTSKRLTYINDTTSIYNVSGIYQHLILCASPPTA